MKKTLPLILLAICVLGCGRFGTESPGNSTSVSNAEKPPTKPIKQIDVPGLLRKTKDEVKAVIGTPPKAEMPEELEYRLTNKYDVDVNFHKGKAKAAFHTMPSGFGANTVEDLGTLAGIDVAGKVPASEFESFITYKGFATPSGSAEVAFNKIGTTFSSVRIELEAK